MWPEIGLRRSALYLLHRLSRIASTPHAIGLGFAVGVFTAFSPLVGLHIVIAALLALALRASVIASAVGTLVGNPLTFPLIWAVSYKAGALLLGADMKSNVEIAMPDATLAHPSLFLDALWRNVEPVFLPLTFGGTLLGIAVAVLSYFAVRNMVNRFQARRQQAVKRGGTRRLVPGE